MSGIVVHGQGGVAGAAPERMLQGDPAAGTYWRAKADVPRLMRTRVDHTFERDGGISTWEEVAREALAAGTILLLASVRRVDRRAHTLVTSGEPSVAGDPAREWLVDDFLQHFEPVADEEAQRDRAAKAAAVQGRIDALQAEMAALASRTDASVLSLPSPGIGSDADPGSLSRMRAVVREATSEVRARVDSIKSLHGSLSEEMRRYDAIRMERARGILAASGDALSVAETTDRTAETLDVFGGKRVEVIPVREGPPAPAGVPLTIYQNRLFLDEEIALFLHRGGFDHGDVRRLSRIVEEHPGIVDRMVPAERGVALVRVRRGKKSYFENDAGIGEILQELGMQRLDTEQFLLVRDGRRLHLVFVETALQEAERLFPTVDEVNRPFRGASGAESIGFDDTRYVAALDAFERQSLVYKRLLVLLWGLQFHDLLPTGRVGREGEAANWYSMDWQSRNLVFVGDDATRSLPDAGVGIREWLRANRDMVQAGSRVLMDWASAITPESAPACATYQERQRGDAVVVGHKPREAYSIHTVRKDGGDLVVDVAVHRTWAGRGRETFNAKASIAPLLETWPPAFLVLDAVDPDDLDHFMESRINRVHYLDYMALFEQARKALADEFAEIRAIDAEIAARLSGILDVDPQAIAAAVRDAHRMWRAENAGKVPKAASFPEIERAAAMVAAGTPTPEAIADIVGTPLGDIVRAGITGRGRLVVDLPGPRDPLLRDEAWVRRQSYSPDGKGNWTPSGETVATIPRSVDPSLAERVRGPVDDYVRGSMLPDGIVRPADAQIVREALSSVTPESVARDQVLLDSPEAFLDEWYREAHRLTYVRRPVGAERTSVILPRRFTAVAAIADLNGSQRPSRLSYLLVTSDPIARMLVVDPSLESRIASRLGMLYSEVPDAMMARAVRSADAARSGDGCLLEFRISGGTLTQDIRKARSALVESPFDLEWLGRDQLTYDGLARRLGLRAETVRSGTFTWKEVDGISARLVASPAMASWLHGLSEWGERPAWLEIREP